MKVVYLWSNCWEKQCSELKLFTFGQTAGGFAFNLTDKAVACYLLITSPLGRLEMSDVSLQSVWNLGLSFDLIPIPAYSPVLLVTFVLMVQSFFHENCPIYFVKSGFFGVSLLLSSRMAACGHMVLVFADIFYFPF